MTPVRMPTVMSGGGVPIRPAVCRMPVNGGALMTASLNTTGITKTYGRTLR